jgi:hypothetical protein
MRFLLASLLLILPGCVTASAAAPSVGTSQLTEEPAPKPRKARVQPPSPRPTVEVAAPAPAVEPSPAADPVAIALRKRGLLANDATSRKDVQASLRAFQKSQGLAETGFADQLTLKRLDVEARK